MARFQLITLDLDNTLWDVESVIRRAETRQMQFLATEFPEVTKRFTLAQWRELKDLVVEQRPDIAHNITLLRRMTLREALLQSGYEMEVACEGSEAAFDVFYAERNRVDFYPDAIETLETLAKTYPLYALSNGNANLEHIGIHHLFKLHLSAESVGAAKPDPRIYRYALEHAGAPAHQALHIGDHPTQDIGAAQTLGMKTVWIDFHDATWPDIPPADYAIKRFRDLEEAIARLEGAG